MNSSISMPETVEDELDLADMRQQLILLYRQRLERLLGTEATGATAQSRADQRRLISRAVMGAVDALTEMGDGTTASQFLREAQRRQGDGEEAAAGASQHAG